MVDYFKYQVIQEKGCVKHMGVMAAEDQTRFNEKAVLMSSMTHDGEINVVYGFKPEMTAEDMINLKIANLLKKEDHDSLNFHPHGIDIDYDDKTLYVINHAYA